MPKTYYRRRPNGAPAASYMRRRVVLLAGDPAALSDDLLIARILRGRLSVQTFLTGRKRPEFLFQSQVLFTGFR
jgi:hypothetical protein